MLLSLYIFAGHNLKELVQSKLFLLLSVPPSPCLVPESFIGREATTLSNKSRTTYVHMSPPVKYGARQFGFVVVVKPPRTAAWRV